MKEWSTLPDLIRHQVRQACTAVAMELEQEDALTRRADEECQGFNMAWRAALEEQTAATRTRVLDQLEELEAKDFRPQGGLRT
jgi:hypothetical protein